MGWNRNSPENSQRADFPSVLSKVYVHLRSEAAYIRIPAKPEQNRLQQYELEDVYEQILSSLVHELTHYFQWINQLQQTDRGAEWQANYYRYRILSLYERSKQIEQHS